MAACFAVPPRDVGNLVPVADEMRGPAEEVMAEEVVVVVVAHASKTVAHRSDS